MSLLSRPKLLVIGAMAIALGVLYWMYQDEIESRVALAAEAGQVTQALQQLEAQQRQLVANIAAREDLRARVEELEQRRRRELEGIHAELQRLREESAEVDRWAAQPVPDALRMRGDAAGGDDAAAAGVPGADGYPALPGTGGSGRDKRGVVGDEGGGNRRASELQREAVGDTVHGQRTGSGGK